MTMFNVTSNNRLAARRLLVGAGTPAATVRGWTLAELASALTGQVLAGTMTREDVDAALAGEDNRPAPAPKPEAPAIVAQPAPAPKPAPAGDDDAAVMLSKAIAAVMAGQQAPLDEARVREIAREAVGQPLRVEVVNAAGDVQPVEGLVHEAFPAIVKALSAKLRGGKRLNVMLVGPAGSGKTTIAEQAAEALAQPFYCTGAVASKYDLIGFVSPTGDERSLRTPFRDAFEKGGVFLWDELDASNPNAIVAFNQALANGVFAFPDGMVKRHADFVAIAACNTWGTGATAEYVGRGRLDAASLNRFVRFEVGYDNALERALTSNRDWCDYVIRTRRAVEKLGIRAVISPRQTEQGEALLAAGLPRADVEAATLFAGLDADAVAKIKREAA